MKQQMTTDNVRESGLRKVWNWICTPLRISFARRPTIKRAPARAKSKAAAAAVTPVEETPVAPVGTVMREAPSRPEGDKVFAPIREGLSEVPPLPHVVRELLRELSDPTSNARSVARIATSDPALAASLIRTVNSAAMGLRHKVSSVAEAVSYLGYSMVRSLVIRLRLQQVMPTRPGQAAYDGEDLWVHSLAVAFAAETLAERAAVADKGFVSTLGLLHDIGKLAINSYFPLSAEMIRVRNPQFPDESFLERERRVLGADHAEIGAMLAEHWKLPGDLVEAIRWHHAPQEAPAILPDSVRAATIVVHAANQLAKYCYVYSEDMEIDIVHDALLRQAGMPAPLTRLLDNRVRGAISRAIFFADENAGNSVDTVRRFLRMAEKPRVPTLPPSAASRNEPHVGWADSGWDTKLVGTPSTIDCNTTLGTRFARDLKAAGQSIRLTTTCTDMGMKKLQAAALGHLDNLGLDDRATLPFRFVLRRLLPNLLDIAGEDEVEVLQSLRDGVLVTAVCSTALSFTKRFGDEVPAERARYAVDLELANVLNLRWFAQVLIPRDGGGVIFVNPVR